MEEPKEKLSAAELTRRYIDRHPSIRDCISKDLVNYSSLARLIMKDIGIKNEEAVLAASRRYAMKLAKTDAEGAIISLFEQSRLELKTKICIVVAKNEWIVLKNLEDAMKKMLADKSTLQVLTSTRAITVSCDTDTIFIVSREDMMRAFDILSSCIEDKIVPRNSI